MAVIEGIEQAKRSRSWSPVRKMSVDSVGTRVQRRISSETVVTQSLPQ